MKIKKIRLVIVFSIFLVGLSVNSTADGLISCMRGNGTWIVRVVNASDAAVEIKNDYKKQTISIPAGQMVSLKDWIIPWSSSQEKMEVIIKKDKDRPSDMVYVFNEQCAHDVRTLQLLTKDAAQVITSAPIFDGKEYSLKISPNYSLEVGDGILGVPVVARFCTLDYVDWNLRNTKNSNELITYVLMGGIDRQNNTGETALHMAVSAQNIEAVKELVGLGASLFVTNNKGYKPFDLAIKLANRNSIAIAVELLRAGASFASEYCRRKNATTLVDCLNYRHWQNNDLYDFIKVLLERGWTDFDLPNEFDNSTPLFVMVDNNLVNEAKLLLDAGAHVDRATKGYKQTVLHRAVYNRNFAMVNLLLERGASIDAENMWGNTPLEDAMETRGLHVIAQLMVEFGIKKGLITPETQSRYKKALSIAVNRGLLHIARLLRDAGVSDS